MLRACYPVRRLPSILLLLANPGLSRSHRSLGSQSPSQFARNQSTQGLGSGRPYGLPPPSPSRKPTSTHRNFLIASGPNDGVQPAPAEKRVGSIPVAGHQSTKKYLLPAAEEGKNLHRKPEDRLPKYPMASQMPPSTTTHPRMRPFRSRLSQVTVTCH
jgi:hypothetical protein